MKASKCLMKVYQAGRGLVNLPTLKFDQSEILCISIELEQINCSRKALESELILLNERVLIMERLTQIEYACSPGALGCRMRTTYVVPGNPITGYLLTYLLPLRRMAYRVLSYG